MGTREFDYGNKTLPIREFKLEWMMDNSVIVMIAKRGSGKSWVCRDILDHYKNRIPGGIIISQSEKNDPFYSKYFPNSYIYQFYSPELMERINERQEKILEKKEEKKKIGKKINPKMFILMDDCLADSNSWKNDKHIKDLFYNGRHDQKTFILTMQDPLGIDNKLRGNIDYFFLFATDIHKDKKRIYENYAGIFPTLKSFEQIFDQVTKNYGVLVIVNKVVPSGDLFDKIFWFRSKDFNPGTIGCEQFIKMHENNYDPNWKKKKRDYMGMLADKNRRIIVERRNYA